MIVELVERASSGPRPDQREVRVICLRLNV